MSIMLMTPRGPPYLCHSPCQFTLRTLPDCSFQIVLLSFSWFRFCTGSPQIQDKSSYFLAGHRNPDFLDLLQPYLLPLPCRHLWSNNMELLTVLYVHILSKEYTTKDIRVANGKLCYQISPKNTVSSSPISRFTHSPSVPMPHGWCCFT